MAVGAVALSKMKAIVTRLESIEEMAGMDVLCSDKTGTLTQNKLPLAARPAGALVVAGITDKDCVRRADFEAVTAAGTAVAGLPPRGVCAVHRVSAAFSRAWTVSAGLDPGRRAGPGRVCMGSLSAGRRPRGLAGRPGWLRRCCGGAGRWPCLPGRASPVLVPGGPGPGARRPRSWCPAGPVCRARGCLSGWASGRRSA
jgi:hypothetical protein